MCLIDTKSKQTETYTILGAWDSEPEKMIISYLAPVAQKLINKKPGEEVEMDTEQGPRTCRIDSIEAAAIVSPSA